LSNTLARSSNFMATDYKEYNGALFTLEIAAKLSFGTLWWHYHVKFINNAQI
jgi:hypothetical protein